MVGIAQPPLLANPNGERWEAMVRVRYQVCAKILSACPVVLVLGDVGNVRLGGSPIPFANRTDPRRALVDTLFFLCRPDVPSQVVFGLGTASEQVS